MVAAVGNLCHSGCDRRYFAPLSADSPVRHRALRSRHLQGLLDRYMDAATAPQNSVGYLPRGSAARGCLPVRAFQDADLRMTSNEGRNDEWRMTSDKLYPRMNYFFSFVIRHSSLVISLCAALVAAAQTDFSLTGWRYWTALDPPKPNLAGESFVRVTLSPSILAQALPGLEDLRIVDDSAAGVPYALVVERSGQEETRV